MSICRATEPSDNRSLDRGILLTHLALRHTAMRTRSLHRHVLSRFRRLVAKHIDATIDIAAREGQKIAPVRIVVVLLAALLLPVNIDERSAALLDDRWPIE